MAATSKKLYKYLAVAMLGVFGLTACDEIVAKPSDYDNAIITSGVGENMDSNLLSIVYDAMREGTLASDVLDELLYQYSVSILGRYNKLVGPKLGDSTISSGTTLKEAVASAKSSDHAVANAFILAHKAYWDTNSDGKRADNDGKVRDDDGAVASENEIQDLISKWDSIEDRIMEKIYAAITGGAYSYRSQFSEKSYLMTLRSSLEKVANYKDLSAVADVTSAGYLTPRVFDAKYDYKDVFAEYLHRENYQLNYGVDENEDSDSDGKSAISYVEDNFIPTIYRELLTEQYLFDQTYNTLGRSYARKVNIISLATKSENDKSAQYLINYFVKNVIYATPTTGGVAATAITSDAGVAVSDNRVGEDEFIKLSDAYKGLDTTNSYLTDSEAFDLAVDAEGHNYYKGTDYGDIMDEYAKILDDPLTTDSSIESSYTSSGTYTKEVGLALKKRQLASTNYVTKGWFIKNGGLSDFSTFRDRLFNIGVATALDTIPNASKGETYDDSDRFYLDGGAWKLDASRDDSKYVARINGSYFLKDSTSESSSLNDIIFYNSDSKTYYLVQVVEAVSSSKFNRSADANNYEKLRGDRSVMAEYVNEVAKILAENETYQTLAKKFWLEAMNLSYHDDVVYDYFVTNFPELF